MVGGGRRGGEEEGPLFVHASRAGAEGGGGAERGGGEEVGEEEEEARSHPRMELHWLYCSLGPGQGRAGQGAGASAATGAALPEFPASPARPAFLECPVTGCTSDFFHTSIRAPRLFGPGLTTPWLFARGKLARRRLPSMHFDL